ncbi:transposase [Paenibacillus lycopersici]|uniref:transposase n=1 Tax=Paenibacillus lycopersici TaxID=2704462 RepID=UPI0021F093AA|nr:transposase [Paenibacillus lycopersici]
MADREISVRSRDMAQKKAVREKLSGEEGYALAIRRMHEPESVIGQLMSNRGFRRFLLRSLRRGGLEVGWLAIAHNLLKSAAVDAKHPRWAELALPILGVLRFYGIDLPPNLLKGQPLTNK